MRPALDSHPPLPVAKQADGHTYERSAIEQWLETHNISPATGVELENKQLIPNHSLRSLIQDFHGAWAWRRKNKVTPPAVSSSAGVCAKA